MSETTHRKHPAGEEPEGPELAYSGRTPYATYIEPDILTSLVHPNTDAPHEPAFIIVTQIMEMHFGLLRRIWQYAIERLEKDDITDTLDAIRRGMTVQNSLLGTWQMLEPMSPVHYNRFRGTLGNASGFQSCAYRELEFLIGAKDKHMLRPHKEMPDVQARLREIYESPSLYDAVLAMLSRQDVPIPDDVLQRDPRLAYTESDPRVVEAWRNVYVNGGQLAELAEALISLADRHTRWRFIHYTSVKRILGGKPGTAGSAGLSWLKRATDTMIFPELWDVRGEL